MPARGPEPMSARSCAILVSDTATTFSAPDSSTSESRLACASNGSAGGAVFRLGCPARAPRGLAADFRGAVGLRLERVGGRRDLQLGLPAEVAADLLGELRVRVEPGPRRGAAERDLAHVLERGHDALLPEADLRGVAGELLTERHGDGVHE